MDNDDGRGTIFCAPTEVSRIAKQCWDEIPRHYPFVTTDAFVVMPNHVHGILFLNSNNVGVQNVIGAQDIVPLRVNRFQKIIPGSIGAIIRGYKIGVTKWYRANAVKEKNILPLQIWQRNYYEHMIRDESELQRIREYIINNPANWEKDELYH